MPVVNITGALGGSQFEPSIAVNVLLPNIMCVVAVDTSAGPTRTGFYRSIDGGQTWTTAILPQPAGYEGAEAPTIDYTFPSTFIVTVHVFNGENDGTIISYTSLDDGVTWTPPVFINRGYGLVVHNDEPFIACDRTPGSPYRGNVYVGYTPLATAASSIFLQRSEDVASTWQIPSRISIQEVSMIGRPSGLDSQGKSTPVISSRVLGVRMRYFGLPMTGALHSSHLLAISPL